MWNISHTSSLHVYQIQEDELVLTEEFKKEAYGQIFFMKVPRHKNMVAQLEMNQGRYDQMRVNYFKIEDEDFKIVRTIATKIPMTKMIKNLIKLPGTNNKYYVDTYV